MTQPSALARVGGIVEAVTWLTGVALLTLSLAWYIEGSTVSRRAAQAFDAQRKAARQLPETASLPSQGGVDAGRRTWAVPSASPLAILRIPRLKLEVPIFEGTDEVTLNRGAGHIADTALPGAAGNSGVAGHRDRFFRPLKDIAIGDRIELDTLHQTDIYRVERTWIVDPTDVWVLDPTLDRTLTLVSCYPFYFVGPAPKRFIVRAVIAAATAK
jgi:sortase A